MLKTEILDQLKTSVSEQTGAKLDAFIAAGVMGTMGLASEAWLNSHSGSLLKLGALILIAARIAIAIKQFLKE